MGSIEAMVEQLAAAKVPLSGWSVERAKQEKLQTAQEKLLWHELTVLAETAKNLGVPVENIVAAQEWWVNVNRFCALPQISHDEEVNHKFGTVKALAAGIAKSISKSKPMVECVWTACPAYVDEVDAADLPGQYVYPNIRNDKVENLIQFNAVCQSGSFVSHVELHTPAPEDGQVGDFSNCLEPEAKAILSTNWEQMSAIVAALPGVELLPDLSIVRQCLNAKLARRLMYKDKIAQAFKLFKASNYIEQTYTRWGADVADVFCAYYLGTILAYGNHKSAFNFGNDLPIKIYFNLELGDSPQSFAGHRIGVDFRHLLSGQDYHLALLCGHHQVVTPWAGK